MAIIVKNLEEVCWDDGNEFVHIYHDQEAIKDKTYKFILCTGDADVIIKDIWLGGSSSLLTYNVYENTVLDKNTGTEITEIPFNSRVESTSKIKILLDPNITTLGNRLFAQDLDSVGMIAAGGLSKQDEPLLSNKFFMAKNSNYGFIVKQRQVETCNLVVQFLITKVPDPYNFVTKFLMLLGLK